MLAMKGNKKMNKTANEIVKDICDSNLEVEIWNILNGIISNKVAVLANKNAEQVATINAIRKINKGKNEAIDALCETN